MTTTTTTDPSRSHVGYIPHDAPLSFAVALALPYELPKSDLECRARFGKPGRRVLLTVNAKELTE